MAVTRIENSYIRFPKSGHISIPARGRRAAAAGLSLHSPCRPAAVFAQRVLYAGVRVLGSRLLPGERGPQDPPLPDDQWHEVLDTWSGRVGRIDSIAMYHRPQSGRRGFSALLLREGRGVGFARVSSETSRIGQEARVIDALNAAQPNSFRVARLLDSYVDDGIGWILTESVPNYPLGAVRRESSRIAVSTELSAILGTALPRPVDVPAHWVPAHGDFAPWNLRTRVGGEIQVIDWEDARYAPPGVDVLYGALTAHVAMGTPLPRAVPGEAAQWVADLLTHRIRSQPQAAEANRRTREILLAIPQRGCSGTAENTAPRAIDGESGTSLL